MSFKEPPAQVDPAETVAETQSKSKKIAVRDILETLLLTLLVFWVVQAGTGRFRIEGHSMDPTLHEGQYLLINKFIYRLEEPQRGDIIVLHFPGDRRRDFIKRVIGLPGDRVEIKDQEVIVNGTVLEEPYAQGETIPDGRWRVPEGHYFVLGDNRDRSSDSRVWSYLPRQDIVGKAWFIYWQPAYWGTVPHYSHSIP